MEIIKLINKNNMEVEFINLGATITKILVPDYKGNFENVVLAYKNYEDYFENRDSIGSIMGRTSGRIHNAKFTLEGKEYTLAQNNNHNNLHGGFKGFRKRLWDFDVLSNNVVKFSYFSEDGEEGFPGNVKVEVKYTLSDENALTIDYKATTDKTTLVNLTNHSYFNLSGNAKHSILGHKLQVDSGFILELDEFSIPTGNLIDVNKETTFNFNEVKVIGKDIDNPITKLQMGYDHQWILKDSRDVKYYDPISKRMMEMTTDYPAVVIYTMNKYSGVPLEYGNDIRYAICFEAQNLPIGYNLYNLEHSILFPDKEYIHTTTYKFKVGNFYD
ncbi:hypothetical protein AN644_01865 [Candidatus Epulonipiscium fishelsonii]|nr:hypothetical protein AN644_01865 [Epulopiscium sp. SCG-C06WGA-EpuloA1]